MECNVKLELIHLRRFFPKYFHADTPAPTSHEQQEQAWLQLNEVFQRPEGKRLENGIWL
jgi:hypothetical protein